MSHIQDPGNASITFPAGAIKPVAQRPAGHGTPQVASAQQAGTRTSWTGARIVNRRLAVVQFLPLRRIESKHARGSEQPDEHPMQVFPQHGKRDERSRHSRKPDPNAGWECRFCAKRSHDSAGNAITRAASMICDRLRVHGRDAAAQPLAAPAGIARPAPMSSKLLRREFVDRLLPIRVARLENRRGKFRSIGRVGIMLRFQA